MLCAEFEDRLTDYLDAALAADVQREMGAHALRCPMCHDLLNEVKNTIRACRTAEAPQPSVELEASILLHTAPETVMTCAEFEDYLTDYLDGFLPATLYHRWERHAALCERCTNLPGDVVRSIGACYSYISEEQPVPAGLHEQILQATLGTTQAEAVRAPVGARILEWLRSWLDVVVTPQLATVATMLLAAVLIGTITLSDDGSIAGMYRASLRIAHGASDAARSAAILGRRESGTQEGTNGQRNAQPAQQERRRQSAQ